LSDDPSKRTGNPFKDFALDIKEIEDEEVVFRLKMARKQIVDWIEAGKDVDLEEWRPFPLKGVKESKILAWSRLSTNNAIMSRV